MFLSGSVRGPDEINRVVRPCGGVAEKLSDSRKPAGGNPLVARTPRGGVFTARSTVTRSALPMSSSGIPMSRGTRHDGR